MKVPGSYGEVVMSLNYGRKEIQIVGDLVAEISWIKLRTDMFDDNKIKIIQSMPEGDSLLVIWIRLITLAGTTNADGYVYLGENLPYTEEMLSIIFGKSLQTVKLALATFQNLSMIELDVKGIFLVNFSKHQNLDKMKELKEYNKIKQQESRARRKLRLENVNDTSMTVKPNVNLDIDKDIDKEINNIEQQVAQVWSRYPNKKGKAKAINKLPKIIKVYGYEQIIRCIERYEQTDTFKAGYIKQGDTFFNGAYIDYLDENYTKYKNPANEEENQFLDL